MTTKSDQTHQRLSTSFNETFPLSLARLDYVLDAAEAAEDGRFRWDDEHITMYLGNKMWPIYPRWARGLGLVVPAANNEYQLTSFGRLVISDRSRFRQSPTQWLMHYHLAAPLGPGPRFWHEAATHVLHPSTYIDRETWVDKLIGTEVGEINTRTAGKTWTAFSSAYASDGLSQLGMVDVTLKGKAVLAMRYRQPSVPVPLWTFAFALVDYWDQVWSDRRTITMDRLDEPGGIAQLFLLTPTQVADYLSELSRRGWVEIQRVAPPYQLARRWDDITSQKQRALENLYDDDAS